MEYWPAQTRSLSGYLRFQEREGSSDHLQVSFQSPGSLDGLQDRDDVAGRGSDGLQSIHQLLYFGAFAQFNPPCRGFLGPNIGLRNKRRFSTEERRRLIELGEGAKVEQLVNGL